MDASSVRGAVDNRWASFVILDVRYVCSGRDAEKGGGAGLYGHPVPVAEVQRGCKLCDRVLRPAMVVIGKGEEEAEEKEGKKDIEAGGKGEA